MKPYNTEIPPVTSRTMEILRWHRRRGIHVNPKFTPTNERTGTSSLVIARDQHNQGIARIGSIGIDTTSQSKE